MMLGPPVLPLHSGLHAPVPQHMRLDPGAEPVAVGSIGIDEPIGTAGTADTADTAGTAGTADTGSLQGSNIAVGIVERDTLAT
eukprot:COSAG02_NODE_43761_length_372_cov_0.556777_1_plen_83_part_10